MTDKKTKETAQTADVLRSFADTWSEQAERFIDESAKMNDRVRSQWGALFQEQQTIAQHQLELAQKMGTAMTQAARDLTRSMSK